MELVSSSTNNNSQETQVTSASTYGRVNFRTMASTSHTTPQNLSNSDGVDHRIFFFHPIDPVMLQNTLFRLCTSHPPTRGTSSHTFLSNDWSQLTMSVPTGATTAIHLPNTRQGDILGIFQAKKTVRKLEVAKIRGSRTLSFYALLCAVRNNYGIKVQTSAYEDPQE
jgi:hypothetical protein